MTKRLLLYFCFVIIGRSLYSMENSVHEDPDLDDFEIVQCNSEKYIYSEIKLFHNYRGKDKNYENVDEQDDWGDTPLHRAIEGEKISEIERLLEKGARCDIKNELGETPLSLMFSKKQKGVDLQEHFEKHGCWFVSHNNFHKNKISFLLQKNALYFNAIVENSMGMPDTQEMIDLFKNLFLVAEKNKKYTQDGTLVSIEKIDCFIQIKLSDLQRLFGDLTVIDVKKVVDLYNPARFFIQRCNSALYNDAKGILFNYPLLQSDMRFNRYIMSELLTNNNEECWKFLLESGFNPTVTHPLFGTILHAAVQALNEHALYFLIYHGANVEATNARDKNPIQMLVERSQITEHKECALSRLTVADKAMKNRIDILKLKENNSDESLSLIIMRTYIDRKIKKLNLTKR